MADKKKRIQTLIAKNISDIIIYDLKSELCALASINEVRVTNDFSYATIYVTHLDKTRVDPLIAFLNSRKGQIRARLSSKLDIYKIPELNFVADDLYDKAERIDKIIERVNKK